MLSQRVRADLALVLCTFIWGATFVVVKDALADVSVLAFLAVRFALASVLMAAMFWRAITRVDRRGVWAGAQIGLFHVRRGFVFQTAGPSVDDPLEGGFHHRGVRRAGAASAGRVWLAPHHPVDVGRGGDCFRRASISWTVPREWISGNPIAAIRSFSFAPSSSRCKSFLISRYVERHSVGGLSFLR